MAETPSAYRLTTPAYQAYDTSSGEQTALRGMTPENMGMMYSMLVGQRADATQAQDKYGSILGAVNRQQAALAQQKMQADELENRRAFLLGGIQHGGLSVGATLQSAELPGLANFLTDQQRAQSVAASDANMQNLTAGKALQASGAGLASATEAGVYVDPGQRLAPGAAGHLSARTTTGVPLDIRKLQEAAANERAGANGSQPQYQVRFNPLSQEYELVATKVGSPEQAMAIGRTFREGTVQDRRARDQRTGGNMGGAGGAGSAAAVNQPRNQQGQVPPPPARSAGLSEQQKASLAAHLGSPVKHTERDRATGRRYAVGENGKRVLLPE